MQHTHLTRDDVDLFLEDESSEVSGQIFLHLLAVCPECYKAGGAILEAYLAGDLKLDFDGLDAMFALTRAEAPGLWKELEGLDVQGRKRLVQKDERFWSWGLAELLCQRSAESAAGQPAAAVELAELAVEVSLQVQACPDPGDWVDLLRGFAWAHVAEARGIAGDFRGAWQALSRAKTIWDPAFEDLGDVLGYEARFVAITEGTGRIGMKLDLAGIAKLMSEAQALFDGGSRDEATLKKILGLLAQGLYAVSLNVGGSA
ncbi:MAG TPA: hypothetical protein VGK45_11235 [Thermoanaerobaculia bacterium]